MPSGFFLALLLAVILPAWAAPAAFAADPVVTITSPTDGGFVPGPNANIAFSATGSGQLTIECDLDTDGAGPVACDSATNHTFAAIGSGTHTVTVSATNNASKVGTDSVSFSTDSTAPTISILAPTSGEILDSSTVVAAFDVVEVNLDAVTCKIDTAEAVPCDSQSGTSISGVLDGAHTLLVTATDMAGSAAAASVSFVVDTTPPTLTITSPTNNAYTPSANVDVAFGTTDLTAVATQCELDGGGFTACTSPYSTIGLPAGVHTVDVRAVDAVGFETEQSVSFTVDTTNPVVAINSPLEGALLNAADVSVEFTATDDHAVITTCTLDAQSPVACTTPFALNDVSDGDHSLTVTATDQAGRSASAVVNFHVDTTPPLVEIDAPLDGAALSSGDVSVMFGATDVNDFEFTCSVDSAAATSCSSPLALTDLADGPHSVTVRAEDEIGNFASDSVSFTVDSANPVVSVSSPTSGAYIDSTSTSINFTATDANLATVTCQLDSQAANNCASPLILNGLSQGLHNVTVTATDTSGRTASASVSFTVDAVEPVVAINFPAQNQQLASTTVNAAFTATDANPIIVECNVDGLGFAPCSSPHAMTGLSQGNHELTVRATDAAGNHHSVARTFMVDTVAPEVSISSPTDGQFFDSTNVSASFTASDDNGVTATCRIDQGSFAPCSSPISSTGLAQGTHTLTVRAVDPAGNGTEDHVTFTVDTIAPNVNVTYPSAGAHVASTNVGLTFTATDANSLTVECQSDGGGFAPCSSPLSLTNLPQGAHTVSVRATDPAGKVTTVNRSFTVDTVTPNVAISSPTAGQHFSSTTVPISFSASDSNLASVSCQLDSGTVESCGSNPRTYSGLSNGDHTVIVVGTDIAGNSAQTSVTFRVDTIAPAVSISSPTSNQYLDTNAVVVSFTASDANDLTVECRLDSAGFAPCSSPYQPTGLAEGSHTVQVRVTDVAGNPTTKSVTFRVDTVAPVVQITSPDEGAFVNSTTVSASFAATDANSLTVQCRIDGGAFSSCTTPTSISGVSQGQHVLQVRATDPAGNASFDEVTITVDSVAPTVSINSPAAGQHLATTNATVNSAVTDTNLANVACQLDGGGFTSCASPSTFSGLSQGDHTVIVRATDLAGNANQASVTFRVDTVAPIVNITSPDEDEFFGGNKDVKQMFSVTETNVGLVECSVSGVNGGAFNACVSGSALDLGDGDYTLTVRVTDIAGNSSTSQVSFWVDRAAPTVTIASPTDNQFVATATPSIGFTATDGVSTAEDLTVECSVDGAGFEPCSPPTTIGPLGEGLHNVLVRATDRAGNPTTVTRSFVVDTIDPAVTIASPSNGSFFAQKNVRKSFAATDTNAIDVECRIDSSSFADCASPLDYQNLSEGTHSAQVRAIDPAGNATTRSVAFVVDTIKPAVSINSPAPGQTIFGSRVGVAFGGSDATLLRFECSANGSAFAACGSPFAVIGLGEGSHSSQIRATDQAGNTSIGSVNFNVDLTSPDTAEKFGVAQPKGRTPRKLTRRSKLIFRDEFNGDALNRRKWSNQRGTLKFPYASAYNAKKESATYARENATVQNGRAVLTLKRKTSNSDRRNPYSSGMIHSGNHFSFRHGYVEARVKVPSCSGCWPAFWMLNAPVDEEWPPEIDIFEFFNTRKDKRPKFNVHWKAGKRNRQWGSKKYGAKRRNYTKGWHTYGLAWNKRRAQVFVDGRPGPIYKTGRNLPKKANYLIFNLALQKGFKPRGENRMYIDYVRVWK